MAKTGAGWKAQAEWLAGQLAGLGAHPASCRKDAGGDCPEGGCAECWSLAAEAETAGAGLPQSRRRGNPRGAAAFGERSRMGAAEGRIRKADAFAESMARTVLPLQAEGLSFRAIADRLNGTKLEGKPCRTRHGCLWQANSVRRLLGRLEGKG